MSESAFALTLPDRITSPVVFASPHSGRVYPETFIRRSVLDAAAIRSSEDAFVDMLFDAAPAFGAPFLRAEAPRAFVDLNRSPDELDPALIHGARKQGHNPRIASGLGVVPRVVANGRSIYNGKLSMDEVQARLDTYWRPYHEALQQLMSNARAQFGQAVLIDCHSMPHEAIATAYHARVRRPEIVLGDRFGASASADLMDRVEAAFANAGFVVARNAPFAGAYITQAYGRPARDQHAIQIEIDRAVYMDEAEIRPNGNFEAVRLLLRQVIAELATLGDGAMPLAAE
jgi:N-formylglutamate deformylase